MDNSFSCERDTETLIDNQLKNLKWEDNPHSSFRNVWKQKPKTKEDLEKLGNLRPDYILYKTNSNEPIIIIEAKKARKNIHEALNKGIEYAQRLNAPIVYATDGVFTKTYHIKKEKPLFLNGEEVEEFINELIALNFIQNNEYISFDKKVINSRKELITIFDKANDLLRDEGLSAGVERFSEFANILFLKLISEREDLKADRGENTFIPQEYRWNYFCNKRPVELFNYVSDTVLRVFKEKFDDKSIFEDIKITNPDTFKKIIDLITPLYLTDTNTDIKGDAFEYFLKSYSTGSNNDLGQYFTPRHIVKTLVKLLRPKLGETIYDPFCGTGGMLTESFKHINSMMPQNNNSIEILRKNSLFGREITSVVRIAKMNMILIGDGHTNIEKINSLSNPIEDKFDVIITNIPFSTKTPYGSSYYLPTENGDSICIQHCLKALNKKNPESRIGIIVPEGFLFDSIYKKEREFLIKNFDLHTIISLPDGVFLPYTSQKTNILYIKIRNENKEKIWFFDVKNDGFTLDNYRKPIKGENDLDKLLDCLEFSYLDIERIKNKDYQLVRNIYDKKGLISTIIDNLKLQEVADIKFGQSAPQDLELFKNGEYPFFRVSDLAKEHVSYNLINSRDKLNEEGIKGLFKFPKGTILFPKSGKSVFKNHRGMLGCEGFVVSHFACIIPRNDKIEPFYLFYCLLNIKAEDLLLNSGYPSIRKEMFESIIIPVPKDRNLQKEIAYNIYKIVELNKQIINLEFKAKEKFSEFTGIEL